MPDWKTHLKIAEIDGIKQEIMETVNKIIDVHHILARMGKLKGVSPESAEWELADIVIDVIARVENENEMIWGLKAAVHHYVLDYLEKSKQHFLVELAKERGLKGVKNYVESISENTWKQMLKHAGILSGEKSIINDADEILKKWFEVNEVKNPSEIKNASISLIWKLKKATKF